MSPSVTLRKTIAYTLYILMNFRFYMEQEMFKISLEINYPLLYLKLNFNFRHMTC